MSENHMNGSRTCEVFFRDLIPEAQQNLCEIFNTAEDNENWDVFPLFTLEREDEEVT